MKRMLRALRVAAVLFFMLTTYISAALLVIIGYGYVTASFDNQRALTDYTQTLQFRRVTRAYFDALYNAVTTGEALALPYDEGVAYFAYGLDTNLVYCSDPAIFDMPAFEAQYTAGKAYVLVCRYSANRFRGASATSGTPAEFDYSYADAANILFDGEMRNYSGTAIIIAVPAPSRMAFTGYGAALIDYSILKNGIVNSFVLLGVFLVSFAAVIMFRQYKWRVDQKIGAAVAWVYLEIKLAVVLGVLLLCIRNWAFPPDYAFLLVLALCVVPFGYVLFCNVKLNGGGMFFRNSGVYALIRYLKRQWDTVLPVSDLQRDLRAAAIRYALFGFALPLVLFFLADLVIGVAVVRLLVPFFLVYLAILFITFYLKYARLVNEVSELERFSALLPLGEKLPQEAAAHGADVADADETDLTIEQEDPLYTLKKNISEIDRAISAQAENLFRHSHKRLAQLSGSLSELKEQLSLLEESVRAQPSEDVLSPDVYVVLRRLTQLSNEMLETMTQNMPVTAPVMKRVDFLSVLDDVINARLPELSAAQITVNAVLPPPPVFITADPRHIHTILDILFSNLAMYALAGSRVELAMKKDGSIWRFSMRNAVTPAAAGADAGKAGFSTGLSLARQYMELNGGKLQYGRKDDEFLVSFVLPVAH